MPHHLGAAPIISEIYTLLRLDNADLLNRTGCQSASGFLQIGEKKGSVNMSARQKSNHYGLAIRFCRYAAAFLVASAQLSGCGKPEASIRSDLVKADAGRHTDILNLVGSRWTLVEVRDIADVTRQSVPLLEIHFDRTRIEISACNRIEADYAINVGTELQLQKLRTTERWCNAPTAKVESFFADQRFFFNVDADILTLRNELGWMLLFKPAASDE